MSQRRCLRLLLPLVLACWIRPPCSAQSKSTSAALDSLRDTIVALDDPAKLQGLLAQTTNDGESSTRRALVELRLGELEGKRTHYDQAIRYAEDALDDNRKSPYPWFVLGLVQFGMYRQNYLVKTSNYLEAGLSYREAALRSWGNAIALDPSFLPASLAFAGLVNSLGHRLLPKASLAPQARLREVRKENPAISLALSRIDFAAGNYDTSLAELTDFLTLGGDSGVGYLESSRVLMALGRKEEAVAAYLAGAKVASADGRLAYREDLAWIAGIDEMASFDSLPESSVHEWVVRFWNERDALEIRGPDERLKEHLRRWVFTHTHYLLHRPDDVPANAEGFGPQDQTSLFEVGAVGLVMVEVAGGIPRFSSYRRTQWEIDDRGVLYLRFGEPSKKVSSVAGPPNESWAYDLPEGRRIFHFIGSRALGTQAATTLTASLPLDPDMLDARADLDSRYAALATKIQMAQAAAKTQAVSIALANNEGIPNTPAEVAAFEARHEAAYAKVSMSRFGADVLWREVARNRRAVAAAVVSDGYPQVFHSSLDAVVQIYGLGVSAELPKKIVVVFAIPGRNLVPTSRPDGGSGVLYPVSFRITALDRISGTLVRLDSSRTFAARSALGGDQHIVGLFELPAPPGNYQVRVLISQPDGKAGTGAGTDSIMAPKTVVNPVLSDLILGRENSGLSFTYTTARIWLNPLNVFSKGASTELFYEVGGLSIGTTYQTSTSVSRADDKPGAKPLLELSSEFVATRGYEQISRTVGLSSLKPGQYIIRVGVAEKSGDRLVRRQQSLNIVDK